MACLKYLSFVIVLLCAVFSALRSAEVCYVRATTSSSCPGDPSLTLSDIRYVTITQPDISLPTQPSYSQKVSTIFTKPQQCKKYYCARDSVK